ncbi:hypothetical protein HJC23_009261 [Cyclotella cryptica]|uniref:Vitamin K epoxide reductase domain-containing protein n=1 Tax=Cyclotella cryptica TaxID=29204 RepID=A0ABD3Q534_9STRA|eukprot:CCRYP_008561-RA/>CCRYP_008561-RA protein AED:0.15 eAED:0.15 QI:0/-1/0/1/-1/1/1/0/456
MRRLLPLVSCLVTVVIGIVGVEAFSSSRALLTSRPWQTGNVATFALRSASSLRRSPPRKTSFPPNRRKNTQLKEAAEETNQIPRTKEEASSTSVTQSTCWNPPLRKQMATVSFLGMIETVYLTYDKLHSSTAASGSGSTSLVNSICSATGSSCNDVLNGPYSSISIFDTDIPLSLLGAGAYTTVFVLSVFPLLYSDKQVTAALDGKNRVALLGMTTLMATFSVYLVSLLLGVLQTSCLFCFVSAGLSVTLAGMSWFGGMLPSLDDNGVLYDDVTREAIVQLRKSGVIVGASSLGFATLVALGLFLTVDDDGLSPASSIANSGATSSSSIGSGTLLASTDSRQYDKNVPPPITTTSSPMALSLATDLSSLNSKMYGAFWCSHCYDQKQALGYQAMQSIRYVECDREGYKNQRELCRERDVPGYPTWEIGGELFPGERSLDELREIVDDVMSKRKGGA